MMSPFSPTTQVPNTEAQKLQRGLTAHSPLPCKKNFLSSLHYILYWLIKMPVEDIMVTLEKSLEKLLQTQERQGQDAYCNIPPLI